MPVSKKNTTEKHSRHKKNDENDYEKINKINSDKDAIKKMVEGIPDLIMKEGYFNNKQQKTKEKITKTTKIDQIADDKTGGANFDGIDYFLPKKNTPTVINHPKKKLWLWIGVGMVTLAIFGIWILNIKNIFYDIRNSKGFEESIIGGSKQDFTEIWKSVKKNDASIEEKMKRLDDNTARSAASSTENTDLKSIIKEIIAPLTSASATAE